MAEPASEEFYIGWAPAPPPGVRRRVRGAVAAALVLAAGLAIVIAAAQDPPAASVFEYGVERELIGTVYERPEPFLVVPGPPCTELCAPTSAWLLARAGSKRGAHELVAGLDGARVRLRGSLVYRGDQTLLDVAAGSVERLDGTAPPAPPARFEDLGERAFTGEIVDGKCWLGVMRPGEGKAHRSCAARCIASGSPPLLAVRDQAGGPAALLLVGADGRRLGAELLPWVGEPVALRGRLLRYENLLVLRTDPGAIRRR